MTTQNVTSGVSPKVSIPAVALAGFGLLAAVLGLLLGSEALTTVGVTTVGAGVAGGFIGYQAPAGHVIVQQEVATVAEARREVDPVRGAFGDDGEPPVERSDDLLPPEAFTEMQRETPAES